MWRTRGTYGAAAAGIALGLIGVADAHEVRFGRMVHLRVLKEGVEVAMVVQLHAGPDALKIRDRFDRDGSGELSDEEAGAMAEWFGSEAFRDFSVHVGGDPVALEVADVALDLLGDATVLRGEELLFRIVQRGVFVLRPGERPMVVRDAPANAREEIAVRIDVPPPVPVADAKGDGTAGPLVPIGEGSYQALLMGRPATMRFALDVSREWSVE